MDNVLILSIMRESELDESIRYAECLGMREDAYIGDILIGLKYDHAGTNRIRVETLLRVLLEEVFFDEQGVLDKNARSKNQEELLHLLKGLDGFSDSHLKAFLMYAMPDSPEGPFLKVLLREGMFCTMVADENNGFFPGEYPAEVLAFLRTAERAPSLQLYRIIEHIFQISRDTVITEAAKRCLDTMAVQLN